jgi:phosphohistidine phosphatase SixA
MKKLFFLILPMILACNFNQTNDPEVKNSENIGQKAGVSDKITTYYFIRHAEKDTSNPEEKDPVLTEAGIKRAGNWAEIFKEVPFDLIYSSDFKRTMETAQKIAGSHNLEIQLYDPANLNDEDFQQKTTGKTVLVIGHSNTNPRFVNSILGEEKYSDIDDKESGSLFIVSISPEGAKTSQVLYIN